MDRNSQSQFPFVALLFEKVYIIKNKNKKYKTKYSKEKKLIEMHVFIFPLPAITYIPESPEKRIKTIRVLKFD